MGIFIISLPPKQKIPLSITDRGRKLRGTTSGSSASHGADLTASNNAYRCYGRPRPPLLAFQGDHSGRYFSVFSHCLAPTGSSLAENWTHTSSHQCVYRNMVAKERIFVKQFQENTCFQILKAGVKSLGYITFLNSAIRPNQQEHTRETGDAQQNS